VITALTKEARALFPIWAASGLVLAAAAAAPNHMMPAVAAAFAYGFGCIILGAQAVGHEYSAGTLAALLAQPAPRSRTLLIKLSVLAVMLAVLTLLALPTVFAAAAAHATRSRDAGIISFAAATAFLLTPYLTMVCRSALGGIVFSVAVPGLLFVLGDLVGLYLYGINRAADIDRFKNELFWNGMLVLLAFGAIAGWHRFMRLQVIDGHGTHVQIPPLFAHAKADRHNGRRGHVMVELVAKELRLQQMTFVIVALYAALGLAAPDLRDDAIVLYVVIVSLLVGALASAEERLFAVHEWQLLLPVPGRQQWRIKAGVALGLALVAGVAVPSLLRVLHAVDPPASAQPIAWAPLVIAVIVLTTGALWISTLSASGVRALAITMPAAMAAIVATRLPLVIVDWETRNRLIAMHGMRLSYLQTVVLVGVLAIPIVGLFLAFGRRNHLSLERSARVIAAQAAWLLGYIVVASTVLLFT
jgi:hypothetical protein